MRMNIFMNPIYELISPLCLAPVFSLSPSLSAGFVPRTDGKWRRDDRANLRWAEVDSGATLAGGQTASAWSCQSVNRSCKSCLNEDCCELLGFDQVVVELQEKKINFEGKKRSSWLHMLHGWTFPVRFNYDGSIMRREMTGPSRRTRPVGCTCSNLLTS
ncbi:hypothetical protein EDB82DRAFT_27858 [Fusarium venenatum]|uniref:uncharacterized protein n=1 Tax=Fusarium venenatum TaxID=56646 RepID=UPI001DF39DE8|nr:hypothetical protein EDB82DRAFT_27858 [Fusarium venenatum]